ncbi:hypothetical protein BGW42_005621 [Actinomortierella wolfii]|nr:hypothetical protein BGW42_005621 [Actinomortierella wolfii]
MKFPLSSSIPAVLVSLATLSLSSGAWSDPSDGKMYSCINPGQVALTFDDGPGQYADELLALLERKNVKTTFFLIGEMITGDSRQAEAVKKYYDAGHQLASHTYTHPNLNKLTAAQMRDEMRKTSDAIYKHAGVRVNHMRPPMGECGAECMKVMTKQLNQTVVQWNVDSNDWRYVGMPTSQAVSRAMKEINELIVEDSDPDTDSFIVLAHEIHQFSVNHLTERMIDAIADKGYTFVTVEECLGIPAYAEDTNNPPEPPATSTTVPAVVSTVSTVSSASSASTSSGAAATVTTTTATIAVTAINSTAVMPTGTLTDSTTTIPSALMSTTTTPTTRPVDGHTGNAAASTVSHRYSSKVLVLTLMAAATYALC